MRINRIDVVKPAVVFASKVSKSNDINTVDKNESVLNGLSNIGLYNQISFMRRPRNFEIARSSEDLKMRTDSSVVTDIDLLDVDSPEFQNLHEYDKKALAHLVKAAVILDDVFLKQDNKHNIAFRNYLEREIANGNEDAQRALVVFNSQKGVNGIDNTMAKIQLAKGIDETLGRGFYPEDLQVDEFHGILNNMLDDGEFDEVQNILNQRSIVVRDGKKLKAVDYTDYFKKEFTSAAVHLKKAADYSTNEHFSDYLRHQAKALSGYNPFNDAIADKIWADMQDTPLEFTITRENYADRMTKTVPENPQLMQRLNALGINVYPKDALGIRVGIINKEGTKKLLGIKKYLPEIARLMPHQELYTQNLLTSNAKQTMVDADLVYMAGDSATIRAGVTIAENLPNADKDSLKMGGGRRNVYHRQVRVAKSKEGVQSKLDALLNPAQHQYYNADAKHKFVIGHENMHSLGPGKNPALGKYVNLFEEMKADAGATAFLKFLVNEGFYTNKERKEIIVTEIVNKGMKSMPELSKTHRACDVIEFNYLYKKGAFDVDKNGIITVYIDEAEKQAKAMLDEIILIQATGDIEKAEKFVNSYFYWNAVNQRYADNLNKVHKTLSAKFVTPLVDALLKTV